MPKHNLESIREMIAHHDQIGNKQIADHYRDMLATVTDKIATDNKHAEAPASGSDTQPTGGALSTFAAKPAPDPEPKPASKKPAPTSNTTKAAAARPKPKPVPVKAIPVDTVSTDTPDDTEEQA